MLSSLTSRNHPHLDLRNSNWNTHDWNNDKPYGCGLETLDGGYAPSPKHSQNTFSTLPLAPKQPIMASKIKKNNPKIKSKSKVRIRGTIENVGCSTTWVDPKTISEPEPKPQKSTIGSKKKAKQPVT